MSKRAIFLTVRKKYSDKIFDGTKTVELRRMRPKHLDVGDWVFVYVPSPFSHLVGGFKVGQIIEATPSALWDISGDYTGVTREEYNYYFTGASKGIGIFINQAVRFGKPIALQELKLLIPGFHAPQSFRYATSGDLKQLNLETWVT